MSLSKNRVQRNWRMAATRYSFRDTNLKITRKHRYYLRPWT